MSPPYVRLRRLRCRIDRSLSSPHLLTGHYGEKTGGGLVTIAQVARIAPVAAWRGLRALLQVRNNAVGGRTVLIVCRTTSRLRNNHFDTQNFDGLHVWDKRKPPRQSHTSRAAILRECSPVVSHVKTIEVLEGQQSFLRSPLNPTSQQQNDQDQKDQA